jgi:hypothetical protein
VLLTKYDSVDQSRRIGWIGHVAPVHTGFCLVNLRERNHLEDPDIDGRMILRWIFRKWDGDMD